MTRLNGRHTLAAVASIALLGGGIAMASTPAQAVTPSGNLVITSMAIGDPDLAEPWEWNYLDNDSIDLTFADSSAPIGGGDIDVDVDVDADMEADGWEDDSDADASDEDGDELPRRIGAAALAEDAYYAIRVAGTTGDELDGTDRPSTLTLWCDDDTMNFCSGTQHQFVVEKYVDDELVDISAPRSFTFRTAGHPRAALIAPFVGDQDDPTFVAGTRSTVTYYGSWQAGIRYRNVVELSKNGRRQLLVNQVDARSPLTSFTIPTAFAGGTATIWSIGHVPGTAAPHDVVWEEIPIVANKIPASWIKSYGKPSGKAKVGKTVSVSKPKFSSTGRDYNLKASYQWRLNGTAIKGATKSKYKVTKKAKGKKLSVKVTVSTRGLPSTAKTFSLGKVKSK